MLPKYLDLLQFQAPAIVNMYTAILFHFTNHTLQAKHNSGGQGLKIRRYSARKSFILLKRSNSQQSCMYWFLLGSRIA